MFDPGACMRRCGLWWTGLLLFPAALAAAPVSQMPQDAIGFPIRQEFRGDEVSLVRTPEGAACVLSVTIDIEASRYLAPGTVEPVPFERIIRSRATSAQFIRPVPEGEPSLRVQLKFAVHPDGPIVLTAGAREIDLMPVLERPGDSVRLTDPADIAAVRAAMQAGGAVGITARSRDTGRTVIDRLEGGAFAALDACATAYRNGVPEPDAPPSNILAIAFTVDETPESRATMQDARICRVEDPGAALYRGRLDHVSGFFSQTETVFATFTPDGEVDRVYVPGIFEGTRRRDGVLAAQLSLAANGNDPLNPARVSGCLGAAPVALCDMHDPSLRRFGFCPGTLLAASEIEDGVFLSDFVVEETPGAQAARAGAVAPAAVRLTGGGLPGTLSGGGGSGGGGGGGRPRTTLFGGPTPSGGPGPEPPPVDILPPTDLVVIPLQPTLLLLLTALATLPLLRRRA